MDSAASNPGRKPWLLCLNLQREFITQGRPFYAPAGPAAATSARRCLSRARDYGWTIVHVQTDAARRARSDEFTRPIDGLEPLPSEPLFRITQRSAFANDELRNRVLSERPPAICLVGFAFAHEGLASLFDGASLGVPIRVVEDAVASPPIGDRSGFEVDRVALAIAASVSGVVSSGSALRPTFDNLVTLGM